MSLDHSTRGKEIKLTQVELDKLPEYSCSLPTGTTVGKRWKRDANAYQGLSKGTLSAWWIGEYVDHPNPAMVNITWTRVRLMAPYRPGRMARFMISLGLLLPNKMVEVK